MVESIGDLLTQYRLRWLGHVARMPDTRHPKKLLFGWLSQKCPAHGVKLRWWDKVRQECGICESSWYMEAQDHTRWRTICCDGLNQHVMAPPLDKPFVCTTCHRSFRRRQDINASPPVLDDNKETCDHILWTASSQDGWLQVQVQVCAYMCVCLRALITIYMK